MINSASIKKIFDDLKPVVQACLRDHPETRVPNTKPMIKQIMTDRGFNFTSKQEKIWKELPNFESLRRIRQKIQHDGFYRADKKTQVKQLNMAAASREYYHEQNAKNYEGEFNQQEWLNSMSRLVQIGRQALRRVNETH